MNITVIHGSMRRGNTYNVTQAVLQQLRAHDDVTITEISVAELDLPFCRSCHTCFGKGEAFCPHRATLGPIAQAIEGCDGLIVSGVCYAMHINAAIKNLVDHFAYYFHQPRLFNQVGLVITTTAGAGDVRVGKYLRQVLGHWGMGKPLTLPMKIQTEKFMLTAKQQTRIHATAEEFYRNIKTGKLAQPSLTSVIVHNSFRAHASVTPPLSPCDSAYWRNSGFAHKVYPRSIGAGKWLMGKLIYPIMRSMFKRIGAKNRQAGKDQP
ncbi:MAG: NAD(P)H-dependent oxidoreductase [Oscillospiraceae bacterium]|nr:NAD(P)H-dependent oxidoreductase [Oscillospiraceae bacterium]